jgi:hypothetical protein
MRSAPILTKEDRRGVLETQILVDEGFGTDAKGAKRP